MPSLGDVCLYKATPTTFQPLLNGNLLDSRDVSSSSSSTSASSSSSSSSSYSPSSFSEWTKAYGAQILIPALCIYSIKKTESRPKYERWQSNPPPWLPLSPWNRWINRWFHSHTLPYGPGSRNWSGLATLPAPVWFMFDVCCRHASNPTSWSVSFLTLPAISFGFQHCWHQAPALLYFAPVVCDRDSLDEIELATLENALTHIQRSGNRWTDEVTQCVLQSIMDYIQMKGSVSVIISGSSASRAVPGGAASQQMALAPAQLSFPPPPRPSIHPFTLPNQI